MGSVPKDDLEQIFRQVRSLQKTVNMLSQRETHVEKQRLLKMVDAELLDALHNMEQLLNFPGSQMV